jgi:hypothetical protein
MIDNEKLATYTNRYGKLSDKLTEYINGVVSVEDLTSEDYIYHIDILNQVIETQHDMIGILKAGLEEFSKSEMTHTNALRFYANEFGSPILAERDAYDGRNFRLDVTLMPLENYVSVEVHSTWENDNDYKHNRRRSIYKKIRDGIVLFRQSLRKS